MYSSGLLGLWLKEKRLNTHAFMEFCPVDAHISLSPKGLEVGQKADRRISACASILGTPEGFQQGIRSGRLGEKIPLTFYQSPFSLFYVVFDSGLLMDN
jgi:hypothetical protein